MKEIVKENNINLKIGQLILYRNRLFYIYKVNSKFVRAFVISNKSNNYIIIKDKKYYTNFVLVKIFNKNLIKYTYKIILSSTLKEINYNQEIYNDIIKKSEENIDNYQPMSIINNINTNKEYLIISKKGKILEIVNINDISDLCYFELDIKNNPFKYSHKLTKEEYNIFLNRINEIKKLVEKILI